MKIIDSLRYSAFLSHIFESLAENRLIPKAVIKRRGKGRIRFLKEIVSHGGVGAEIGVQKGFFTHAILCHTKPSKLHLIDPWYLLGSEWHWAQGNKSTSKALRNIIWWFSEELASGRIVLHIGFDQEVLAGFPDRYFDWVYLDTSHTYDDTKQELALLAEKVKPNGTILGDDWFSDPDHMFYGQYVAIKEFVAESEYEIIAASDDDHQWAIKRK